MIATFYADEATAIEARIRDAHAVARGAHGALAAEPLLGQRNVQGTPRRPSSAYLRGFSLPAGGPVRLSVGPQVAERYAAILILEILAPLQSGDAAIRVMADAILTSSALRTDPTRDALNFDAATPHLRDLDQEAAHWVGVLHAPYTIDVHRNLDLSENPT